MRYVLFIFIVLALPLSFTPNAFAEEKSATQARPPWLQSDVLKAGVAIDLTEEQKPQFRQAVTALINNQVSVTNRLLRRNNVDNLERKLKTASNRQFKKMDKSMKALLTAQQFTQYGDYRAALKEQMVNAAISRSGSNNDALGGASSALNGFGQSH